MLKKAIQLNEKTNNTSYEKPERKEAIKVLLKLQ